MFDLVCIDFSKYMDDIKSQFCMFDFPGKFLKY